MKNAENVKLVKKILVLKIQVLGGVETWKQFFLLIKN